MVCTDCTQTLVYFPIKREHPGRQRPSHTHLAVPVSAGHIRTTSMPLGNGASSLVCFATQLTATLK